MLKSLFSSQTFFLRYILLKTTAASNESNLCKVEMHATSDKNHNGT